MGNVHQQRKQEAADLTRLAGLPSKPRALHSISVKGLRVGGNRLSSKSELRAH